MSELSRPGSEGREPDRDYFQLIYRGDPAEIIDRLTQEWTGVGVVPAGDVEAAIGALMAKGFVANDSEGLSRCSAGDRPVTGDLHRHGEDELILHRTERGTGTVNLYWSVENYWDYLDPETDELRGSVTGLPVNPEQVIIFPSRTWHQFNTDAGSERVSRFRHYRLTTEGA